MSDRYDDRDRHDRDRDRYDDRRDRDRYDDRDRDRYDDRRDRDRYDDREDEKKKKKGAWIAAAAALVVLALVAGVLVWGGLGGDDDETAGEILLEPVSSAVDPFSADPFGSDADPCEPPMRDGEPAGPPPQDCGAPPAPPTGNAPPPQSTGGGRPGLFGGTSDNGRCDAPSMIAFLQANPAKAQAWVDALNKDPNLNWSGGTLTVADIPAYIGELTPLVLTADTRVTNHGFVNNKANPIHSVLQAGSAVLVDKYGVPRVKCFCGNPLLPADPGVKGPFKGDPWPGFDPAKTVIINQSTTIINNFEVRLPEGGTGLVPAGGSGTDQPTTTTPGTTVPGTTAPGTTAPPTTAPGTTTPGTTAPPTTTPNTTAPPTTAPPTTAPPTTAPPTTAPDCTPKGATVSVSVQNNSGQSLGLFYRPSGGCPFVAGGNVNPGSGNFRSHPGAQYEVRAGGTVVGSYTVPAGGGTWTIN